MSDGSQIVQQSNVLKAKVAGHSGFFEVPWQIRQVRAPAAHGAGHVERVIGFAQIILGDRGRAP